MWAYVPPADIPGIWPEIRDRALKVLKRGCGDYLREEYIVEALSRGAMFLWVFRGKTDKVEGAIVIEENERPKGKVVTVVMSIGTHIGRWCSNDAVVGNELLKSYAEAVGAYAIEAYVRIGLVDKLRSVGWRQKAVVMTLEK